MKKYTIARHYSSIYSIETILFFCQNYCADALLDDNARRRAQETIVDRTTYSFSDHAMRRAQQRAIRPEIVDFILQNADVDLEAGNGCRAHRISNRGIAQLLRRGALMAIVERVRNIVVIMSDETGEVVTALHDCNRRGCRYRKQWPTWSRPGRRYAHAA